MARRNSQVEINSPNLVNQKGLSYINNVGKNHLVYRTIGQELGLAAKEYGDKEAFVFIEENRRFTYKQLLREADQLAAAFQCLGAKIGDCVAFLVPNVSTWPILMFAAARAGLISVTLNPTYSAAEIESCLKKTSAKFLIASEKFGHESYYDKIREIIPEIKNIPEFCQSKNLHNLSAVIMDSNKYFPGTLRLKDVMRLPTILQINNIENQQGIITPDSACNIQFTSGFTGSPKAVLLSHFGIINTGYHMKCYELGCPRFCMTVPVCHIVAFGLITMPSLCTRGTVVVPSCMFNPEKILFGFIHEKCYIIPVMPKMMIALVSKQMELKLDIKNLTGIIGGDICSPKLLKESKYVKNVYL